MSRWMGTVAGILLVASACAKDQSTGAEPAAEPIELESIELPHTPDEPPRLLVRVALGTTAATIHPEGSGEIAVAHLDELDDAVAKLAAAGLPPDRVSVSFSGADATYQQLVSAMDAFLAHGYRDIEVESGTNDVPHTFPSEPPDFDSAAAAIVVVAPDDIYVDGTVATATDSILDDAGARRLVEAIHTAHPTSTLVILQADKAISMRVITRVLDVARGAGFRDVMFAVNAR